MHECGRYTKNGSGGGDRMCCAVYRLEQRTQLVMSMNMIIGSCKGIDCLKNLFFIFFKSNW